MKDETKAGLALGIWLVVFYAGLYSMNLAGYMVSAFSTVILLMAIGQDIRQEQTMKRLKKYIDHQNDEIREETRA
jgi:hypothetical protein